MITCHNCGNQMKEGSGFCTACGSKIDEAPQQMPKKPGKRWPLVVAVATIVLAGVVAAALHTDFFGLRADPEGAGETLEVKGPEEMTSPEAQPAPESSVELEVPQEEPGEEVQTTLKEPFTISDVAVGTERVVSWEDDSRKYAFMDMTIITGTAVNNTKERIFLAPVLRATLHYSDKYGDAQSAAVEFRAGSDNSGGYITTMPSLYGNDYKLPLEAEETVEFKLYVEDGLERLPDSDTAGRQLDMNQDAERSLTNLELVDFEDLTADASSDARVAGKVRPSELAHEMVLEIKPSQFFHGNQGLFFDGRIQNTTPDRWESAQLYATVMIDDAVYYSGGVVHKIYSFKYIKPEGWADIGDELFHFSTKPLPSAESTVSLVNPYVVYTPDEG